MKDNNVLEKIGEAFGSEIVELVRSNRAFTVTIDSVDDEYAYVKMMGGKETLTVPLAGMSTNIAAFTYVPAVDSLAVVVLADGSDTAPFFIAFGELTEMKLTVGESSIGITSDEITFNAGEDGGMVVSQKIVDRLNNLENGYNDLVENYNEHIHITSATVGATTTPGIIQPTTSSEPTVLVPTINTDIENEKIKQ